MKSLFSRFAARISQILGSPASFLLAISLIVLWAFSGQFFNYSPTWQLIVNTGTTIVTFLMVFLIQNTQNRDSKALHLKLDELLKADKGARNSIINIEELSDEELDTIHEEFKQLQHRYAQKLLKHNIVLEIQHKKVGKD